jgi:hypothetical protein
MFTFDPAIFALSFEGFVSGDYSTYNLDGKTLFIMDKCEKRDCTIQLYKTT